MSFFEFISIECVSDFNILTNLVCICFDTYVVNYSSFSNYNICIDTSDTNRSDNFRIVY